MLLELYKFIFTDPKTYFGTIVLMVIAGDLIANIVAAARSAKKEPLISLRFGK